jgi:hypothetical protein
MNMKTILKMLLAAGVASTLLAQSDQVLRAQKLDAAAVDTRKREMQTFEFVSGQLISGPPVKGAPYSAEAVNETIQTLADGNRIVQRSSAMQYRDSDGRERREEISAMGAVFITDPVAGVRFTLHPETRTAEKGATGPTERIFTTAGGGNVFYYASERGVAVKGAGEASPLSVVIRGTQADVAQPLAIATAGRLATVGNDAKTEHLGNMYIEGVQAQGTRTTTTIPAGDIGNDRPINIVDERWYSPDLQMTIMTKHSDPRTGETSFALKNINRSSPPPTLFEIPSDYTVTAGGGRGGPVGAAVPAPRVTVQPQK